MNTTVIFGALLAASAGLHIYTIWRIRNMTPLESAMNAVAEVKSTLQDVRSAIMDTVYPAFENFADKLAAFKQAVEDAGTVPTPLQEALADLVDAEKPLLAAKDVLLSIPGDVDAAFEGLAPHPNDPPA